MTGGFREEISFANAEVKPEGMLARRILIGISALGRAMTIMKASCLCGGVTYDITGPIHRARFCHCVTCRKFSGTAYAAWGLIETANLTLGQLSAVVNKFDSGNGLRAFCSTCGSPLWYEPTALPHFRGIPLGVLDDEAVVAPQMHVWTQSKVPWKTIADDLPQYLAHP